MNLLVSNSSTILAQLRMSGFRSLDLDVRLLHGGTSLSAEMARETPDAVILEFTHEGSSDAFALCKQLRTIESQRGLASIPVVVVSSGGLSRDLLARIAESGCDAILTAPLTHGQLYTALGEHLDLPMRRHVRTNVQAAVIVNGTPGELRDLSAGGARMRLERPLQAARGDMVHVELPPGKFSALLVWIRSHARGTELAVQFGDLSERVVRYFKNISTWHVEQCEGHQLVVIQQRLDEHASFDELRDQLGARVVFDLGRLALINSTGVRAWISFLRNIPKHVEYSFVRCSVAFCMQAAYLPAMIGRGAVTSFFAPYECIWCRTDTVFEIQTEALLAEGLEPPEHHCAACGEPLTFADLPERYFSLVSP